MFQDELTYVFDANVVMVGRAGLIPHRGDYFTAMGGQSPVIIMRQEDGSIAAMGNFCLHRYVRLLESDGNAKRIICPYHHRGTKYSRRRGGCIIGHA